MFMSCECIYLCVYVFGVDYLRRKSDNDVCFFFVWNYKIYNWGGFIVIEISLCVYY